MGERLRLRLGAGGEVWCFESVRIARDLLFGELWLRRTLVVLKRAVLNISSWKLVRERLGGTVPKVCFGLVEKKERQRWR